MIAIHNNRTLEEISLDDHEVESFLEGGINNVRGTGTSQLDLPNRPTTVSRRTDDYMERGYDAAHPKGSDTIPHNHHTTPHHTIPHSVVTMHLRRYPLTQPLTSPLTPPLIPSPLSLF